MKYLKRILMVTLSLMVTCLVIMWGVLTIMNSATTVNRLILASGAYEMVALQTRTLLSSNANIPEQYQESISSAFEKSITAKQIETVVQPLLVDVVGWLEQPSGTPEPQLLISLGSIKTQMETELGNTSLTDEEKTVLIAQVGKQIPDQIDLAQAQGLASDQELTPSSPTPATQAVGKLGSLKAMYNILTVLVVIVGLGCLILVVLLVFLGRRDGRALLRRPAWALISAGIFLLVIQAILHILPIDSTQQMIFVTINVAREVLGVITPYSAVVLLLGASLYGLSYLMASHESPTKIDARYQRQT